MSDVDALLDRLRGESEHTAHGGFTLDRERAREKMRQFQLADPHRWIVLLVRAAVLRGATRVRVTIDATSVTTAFDGPALDRADFEELYASMFASSSAPAIQARRDLALACNAAMALAPERLRVESGTGAAGVRFEMRPDAPDEIVQSLELAGGTRVHLVFAAGSPVMELLRGPARRGPEQRLLVEACAWSETAIELEQERISFGIASLAVRGRQPIGDGGACGFASEAIAASVTVLQHGLVLTKRRPRGLPAGFVAVVDGSHLRTDVSRSEPVEDEAWEQLLAAVHAAASRSLVAVAREVLASTADRDAAPPWLWTLLRERLAAAGPIALAQAEDTVVVLVDLPLWRRGDGAPCTTRALLERGAAGYTTHHGRGPLPPAFADVLVMDEAEATALRRMLPFAVDRSAEVSAAIERAARSARAQTVELPIPAPTPACTSAVVRRPPAKTRADQQRARFLARPQLWKVQQPPLVVGPLALEHAGLRCTIGVLASVGTGGGSLDVARVRVIVERRVLTEMKVPCPLPGIDAIVEADAALANPAWTGLADDAARHRVVAALGAGLCAVVTTLSAADGPRSAAGRVVLIAAVCAPLFDPLFYRAWLVLRGASASAAQELATLLEIVERDGLPAVRTQLEGALAAGPDDAPTLLSTILVRQRREAKPCVSLRAVLCAQLEALLELPLFGTPPRSLTDISRAAKLDGGLQGRERDALRRVLGIDPLPAGDGEPIDEPVPSRIAEPIEVPAPTDDAAPVRGLDDEPPPPRAATLDEPKPEPEPAPPVVTDFRESQPRVPAPARVDDPRPATTHVHPFVDAVTRELRAIQDSDERLVGDARLARIELREIEGRALALVDGDAVVLNRRHAVVAAALAAPVLDLLLVGFAASAVYTAVNTWLDEITDEHEAHFIAAHALHVTTRSDPG